MEITKRWSKLHRELQLEEYLIPFKELDKIETKEEFVKYCQYFQIRVAITSHHARKFLDDIKNKEEFIEYIEYFEIDKYYLLEQICKCKYLDFLHEYMKDDIVKMLKRDSYVSLNDENLDYISKYIEIIELDAVRNKNITTVKPFAKTLKILRASGCCGINDDGLKEACNLEELYVANNPNITTVEPFANTLKILYAEGNCGIDDNGLDEAINLQILYPYNNPKITKKMNKKNKKN